MILHAALLLLAIFAFFALGAGLPRHQEALCGRRLAPAQGRALRIAGWVALAALLAIAWAGWGFGRAAVMLAGYATLGAALTVAWLTARSGRARNGRRA